MPAFQAAGIHALFCDAFNRNDVEAIVNLYEPEAVLVLDGSRVTGRDAIREAYMDIRARGGQMSLSTRSISECGGVAILHGDWTIGPGRSGISTELVRKQPDGTWLFVIDEPQTPSASAAKANV